MRLKSLSRINRKRRYRLGNNFTSCFEEKKILTYLENLIVSKVMASKTEALICFAMAALGQRPILGLIKKDYPEVAKRYFKESLRDIRFGISDEIPTQITKHLLKKEIPRLLSKRLNVLSTMHDTDMDTRLSNLQKIFGLTKEELDIVSFYYLNESSEILESCLSAGMPTFSRMSELRAFGDILLGLSRDVFLDTLTKTSLFKAAIIHKDSIEGSLSITSWCSDYLCGLSKADLSNEFFSLENDETLDVADFNIPEDDLLVLDTLLLSNNRQNMLLYGAPGTGKSSFARSLAKKYGKELFSVKTPETDEHKDRLRAVFATVNLADKDNSIILVDEADEVINSSKSRYFESKTNKSWINQFLESHDKKVIWITNRSSEIDPSTMRRFSFSLEFKEFDKKNRLKVIKYEFKKKGLEGYLSDEELSDLCKTYSVDASGIVNAISTLNITDTTDKGTALRKIRSVLKSHEKATGGKKGTNQKEREFDSYSLDGLNTSRNLGEIITSLKSEENQRVIKNASAALLLYGMPGTGKSEFVYYLGHALSKEVLLKRSSDILSKFVGEAEENTAKAFAEAQGSDNILFFDEADTFLFPRKSARHSWEISFTNEILTQLESYKGIVVFATNDMEGLDHAALRRFKFKIEFKSLKPEGILHFYNKLLCPLVQGQTNLSGHELVQLKSLSGLTPGDFAVVKDQFLFVDPAKVTHEKLLEALRGEVMYKKSGQGIKGFAA